MRSGLPIDVLDIEHWQREATRTTTASIIEKLEWSGLTFQFVALFIAALVDDFYRAPGNTVLMVLAILHLPLAVYYGLRRGPISRGGHWIWLSCAQALGVPLIAALMVYPGRYGEGPGTPLCNYAAPPILFLTMYVYVSTERLAIRMVQELLIVLVPVLEPFVLVLLKNPHPSSENYTAMLVGQIQLIAAYLSGRAVVQVCRVAVGRQLETQQLNYNDFFNFLHSHVKAGLASVRAVQPDTGAMLEKLEELEQAVSDRRLQMLFVQEQIPLAVVISERLRTFTGRITFDEQPRVGVLTVSRPVGSLINRALGDLLKNVLKWGGSRVRVRCRVGDGSRLILDVLDNGPGFDATVLNNPAKSLNMLRATARKLGGDLTRRDAAGWNHLQLVVPLIPGIVVHRRRSAASASTPSQPESST